MDKKNWQCEGIVLDIKEKIRMVDEDARRRVVLLILLWHVYILSIEPSLIILRWSTAQDRCCLSPRSKKAKYKTEDNK